MAIKVFKYPEERVQFEQYTADNQPNHVWHDGAVMRVFTGEDIPAQPVLD